MRVVCASEEKVAKAKAEHRFVLFGPSPDSSTFGSIGSTIQSLVARKGVIPSMKAWDFLAICMSVVAADKSILRRTSPDGWTREIELSVSVDDPDFWNEAAPSIVEMLSFLTGDIWTVSFERGEEWFYKPRRRHLYKQDSVSLLSGGLDSLIGSIEHSNENRKPLLVSQVAKGDKTKQRYFSEKMKLDSIQLPQTIHLATKKREGSTRSRSLAFFGFGVLFATSLRAYEEGKRVNLFIPENGYISLNIPLTPMRIGTLNTKTTHPVYVSRMQSILDQSGVNVKLTNPYQFKTKGEMLLECSDQSMLRHLASQTSSCGKSGRINQQCGRCIPCLVRRAAFFQWGEPDTTSYRYEDLSKNDQDHKGYDDVKSALIGYHRFLEIGIERYCGAGVSSALLGDVSKYYGVAGRGIKEIGQFLTSF